ncbi:NADH-dependent oxidoreductase [Enterococcus hulanensis]|uniref:oxidoreductase n=1 Tax=Enterococcus hulanensis TaxID=2559929 RepID=UPI002891C5A5|nr:NADH-dependent oxidoreductase [Enterococcus hulanensis]MDT2659222.1 NADH-dependent oxidoreductase [Enterococcus hulanensis]
MKKNNELLFPYTFPNGAVISNRIAMAPITTKGSSYDGFVLEEDIDFYSTRSSAAGLIITGATSVSVHGEAFSYQFSISDDRFIEGLSRLAKVMKKDGGKAILQIYHGGRQANVSQKKLGYALSPSFIDFPFLDYDVREMSVEEVWSVIKDFGKATKRAIAAGFDGVEIHGANHHLIQQFFSAYSNKRKDFFGGDLRKRMNFPLEVVKEVKDTIQKSAANDFIIGYRITQTEIHGDNIGYTIDDALQLIDEVVNLGIDYLHVSRPEYGDLIKECINGRAAYIFMPRATSQEEVYDAINLGNIVAIARLAILNPSYAKTIKKQPDRITYQINPDTDINKLKLPKKFKLWFNDPISNIPKFNGVEYL